MSKKNKRRFKKLWIAAPFAVLCVIALCMQIAVFAVNETTVYWRPEYEKADLSELLDKAALTDEDYEFLYRQTGLTAAGVNRCLQQGENGKRRIKEIQQDFFDGQEINSEYWAPFCCTTRTKNDVAHCYLENGDILITSTAQFSGFMIGHAGIVIDSDSAYVLQANGYGSTSAIGSTKDVINRPAFIILSPKADSAFKNEVAEYAVNNLTGKIYNVTAGVFSDKNSCERTQCAHIVWYAYNEFGIDIDGDGGLIVTPKDIAGSQELEVVQVFGFDLDKLWD